MSQIIRKWVQDSAINNEKIDEADIYTVTGLLVDSTSGSGRVGIGVTEPFDALHIRRPDTSAGLMLDLNDGASGRTYQLYSSSTGVMNIQDHDTGIDRFTLRATTSLGNIGISTVNPLDTIHARAEIGSSALRLDLDDGIAGQAYQLVSNSAGDFAIVDVDDSLTTRLLIDSTGTTTIPGDTTVGGNFEVNGTVTVINTEIVFTDQLEINQTDTTQAALIASQDNVSATETVVKFENASTLNHAFTVDRGNVGFGTTDPQAELHVEGDIVGKLSASGSNIGSATRRISTLFMNSHIDHVGNLNFNGTNVTFSTAGRVGIGSTLPAQPLDVVGNMTSSATVAGATLVSNGAINATSGTITGSHLVSNGNVTASSGIVTGGTVNSGGNINAVAGGAVITGTAIVSNSTIQALSGAITGASLVSNGAINATGGTITGANLVSNGNVTATAGTGTITGKNLVSTVNITATAGTGTITGKNLIATVNITATTGTGIITGKSLVSTGGISANTTVTAGGLIRSTGGGLQASTTVTAGGLIRSTGGGLQAFSTVVAGTSLQVGTTSYLIGNVGIGTAAHASEGLHVYKATSPVISIDGGTSTYLKYSFNNGSEIGVVAMQARVTATSNDFFVGTTTGGACHLLYGTGQTGLKILDDSSTRLYGSTLRIDGDVGIGTAVGSDKVFVYNSTGVAQSLQADAGNYTNQVRFRYGSTIGGLVSCQRTTGPLYTTTLNATGTGSTVNLSINGSPELSVESSGVGIGTAVGSDRLTVYESTAAKLSLQMPVVNGTQSLRFRWGTSIEAYIEVQRVTGPDYWMTLNADGTYGKVILAVDGTPELEVTSGAVEVFGDLTCGYLYKGGGSFLIDHPLDPENKTLQHSFIESPEMRNMYYGQAETSNGSVFITLPDWWEALNGKEKSEYTYQLTPIGDWRQLYVSTEIHNNQFEVSCVEGNSKFSWTVSAIRHDKFAEKNRILVEEEKVGDKKGKLIHDI